MKQRGIVRLALVLALVLGGYWTLQSAPDPELPLAFAIAGHWVLNGALLFVVFWVLLSLVAWAIKGFSK